MTQLPQEPKTDYNAAQVENNNWIFISFSVNRFLSSISTFYFSNLHSLRNMEPWVVETFYVAIQKQCSTGRDRSFENCSLKFSSKTGKRMDWLFIAFLTWPNLTCSNRPPCSFIPYPFWDTTFSAVYFLKFEKLEIKRSGVQLLNFLLLA